MKLKYCFPVILGIISYTVASSAIANKNPCDVDCVNRLIAQNTTITFNDWSAVCESGTLATGCLGNISSKPFSKINTITKGFTSLANLTVSNVPNSVYLQVINGAGGITPNPINNYLTVTNNSANVALCGLFNIQGFGFSEYGLSNCQLDNGNDGESYLNITTILAGQSSASNIYYQDCKSNDSGYTPVTQTFMLMCLGSAPTHTTSAPASLIGGLTAS